MKTKVMAHLRRLRKPFKMSFVTKTGELREGTYRGVVEYEGYIKVEDVEKERPTTIWPNRIVKINKTTYLQVRRMRSITKPLRYFEYPDLWCRIGDLELGTEICRPYLRQKKGWVIDNGIHTDDLMECIKHFIEIGFKEIRTL